jgi:hypothetical protein
MLCSKLIIAKGQISVHVWFIFYRDKYLATIVVYILPSTAYTDWLFVAENKFPTNNPSA